MLKAALTGNYGSGKSAVLAIFRRLGAICIDSDRIVAGLLEDRAVLGRIRQVAGGGVFAQKGGGLSREKLARLIFSDRRARGAVEGIIHPLVMEVIEKEFLKTKAGVVVVEVPLLYEKGFEGVFDKVISVYAGERTALARLQKKGIARKDALRRLAAQMPTARKIEKADYVIDNEGGMELTERQASRIYKELTGRWTLFRK